jgi:dUTP pyrophosphatase
MSTVFVNWLRLCNNALLPSAEYAESAGADLYAMGNTTLLSHKVTVIPFGFAAEFSGRYVAILKDRSSMSAAGVHVLGGVIESEYRGEWKALLYNSGDLPIWIEAGDRVCQVLFYDRNVAVFQEAETLGRSVRGERGFGSTGK